MSNLTLLAHFNAVNGILAAISAVLVLVALFVTLRFKRVEKEQDTIATIAQDVFHIGLYTSVFLIAVDHIFELFDMRSVLTDFLSPPLSDMAMICAAAAWSIYRLRKHWLKVHGFQLTEDLRVVAQS